MPSCLVISEYVRFHGMNMSKAGQQTLAPWLLNNWSLEFGKSCLKSQYFMSINDFEGYSKLSESKASFLCLGESLLRLRSHNDRVLLCHSVATNNVDCGAK